MNENTATEAVEAAAVQVSTVQAAFGLVDWGVVLIYLVVIMSVGLWTSRGQTSRRDYFLGGRNLPWWVVSLSIIATETSALTFIGIPAMAFGALKLTEAGYTSDGGTLFFMMLVIGHVIGRLIIAAVVVPRYFRGDVYTTYQMLEASFGGTVRRVAALIALLGMALGAGVRVLVTAIPMVLIFQTYPATANFGILQTIMLIMVFALVYTAIGGLKAVVWTDMMQFFLFLGGGLFALFYIPSLLTGSMAAPSGAEGFAAAFEVAPEVKSVFNSGIPSEFDPNQNFFAQLFASIFQGPFNVIMGLIAVPIGIVFALGFDQLNVQRVLGCRNIADGRKAMLGSAILIAPQFFLFLLVGIMLLAYYRLNGFEFGSIAPADPKFPDAPKSDFVFPLFILSHMPSVVKGFMMAAILAAAMSSVSSALSAMASIVVVDFWNPIMGESGSEKHEMLVSRITVGLCGVALTAIAYYSREAAFLFDLAFTLAGLTAGAILGAFIWGLFVGKAKPWVVIFAMIYSVLAMLLLNLLARWEIFSLAWPWHAPLGTLISFGVIYALEKANPFVEQTNV